MAEDGVRSVTFEASLGWSLLRAVLITVVGWPAVQATASWFAVDDAPRRRWRLAVLLVPFVFPELLVGYAYAQGVAGRPFAAQVLCAVLMALRLVPVGTVAYLLTPASIVTPSARFCRTLRLRNWRDRVDGLRLWIAGSGLRALPAVALMTLVGFQQFELAALLKAVSWTDWLFVQQYGGLSLHDSLRAAAFPAVLQLVLVLAAGRLLSTRPSGPFQETASGLSPVSRIYGMAWMIGAWGLVVAGPTISLASGIGGGMTQLWQQPARLQGLGREFLSTFAMAVLAALLAWACVDQARRRGRVRRLMRIPLALLMLSGLMGSLVMGLLLIGTFQSPGLRMLYDTPLPWCLGLFILLLPRAWVLREWLNEDRRSGLHCARLLLASGDAHQRREAWHLRWRLQDEPRFFAVALLVCWGYLDLTVAYLLAPTGMSSGVVRLYNFMHSGRTAALSAEAAVLLAGPVLLTALCWPVARWMRK